MDTSPSSWVASLAEGSLPSLVADLVVDTCLGVASTFLVAVGSLEGTGVACLGEGTFRPLEGEVGPTRPRLVRDALASHLSGDLSDSCGENCDGCCNESHLRPCLGCTKW